MAESGAEWLTESDAETRWLSYHQIAALRGISRASAAKMARLHRWPRRKSNSEATVVGVPLAYAEPNAAESRANPPERPAEIHAESGAISALHSVIDTLHHQLVQVDQRADKAKAERDSVRVERDAARAETAEVQRTLDAIRAGGRWARLRAAWRGE